MSSKRDGAHAGDCVLDVEVGGLATSMRLLYLAYRDDIVQTLSG